jgi:hypothetical protein
MSIPTGKFGSQAASPQPTEGSEPTDAAQPSGDNGAAQPEDNQNQEPSVDSNQQENNQDPQAQSGNEPSNAAEPSDDQAELEESKIKDFFKKKYGKEVDSFDELFKEPEGNQQSTTLEDRDEEVLLFERFKKENGGGLKEFNELHKDWGEVSDLDVIREQIKEESGINDKKKIDALIKRKYDIDPDEDLKSLDEDDKVFIEADANKFRKHKSNKNAEILEKLKQGSLGQDPQRSNREEMITLNNGQQVTKEQYKEMTDARDRYLETNQKAIDEISEAKFSAKLTTKDGEKSFDFNYQYTDQDKQSMLSTTEDLSKALAKFKTEDGQLNHKELNEGLLWANREFRENAINKIVQQALSNGIQEQLKEERNIVDPKNPQSSKPSSTQKRNKVDHSKLPGGNTTSGPMYSFNKRN